MKIFTDFCRVEMFSACISLEGAIHLESQVTAQKTVKVPSDGY